MTDIAKAQVLSLLERWNADPQSLAGLISETERDAIRALLEGGVSEDPVEIDRTAIERKEVEHSEVTLCFDFGTARSKVCAVATNEDDDEVTLVEIPLGDLDGDVDRSVYAVASSIWIDETGLVFVGSEAIRRSQASVYPGAARARVDSLKHLVSLAPSEEFVTQRLLGPGENPTGVTLTLDHVVVVFLGYLTDLATSYLAAEDRGRYVRRRFSLPCWPPEHRAWSTPYLSARLAAAQVVADTFRGQWGNGIQAAVVRECAAKAIESAKRAEYLMDRAPDLAAKLSKHWGGILEPLAAGSTRVWRTNNSKEAVLVLDVGAGTTDLALLWVVQLSKDTAHPGNRAFPMTRQSEAIRVAGDHLDNILINELMKRAHLDGVEGERKQAEASLRLAGIRRLKEELFNNRLIRHKMSNDLIIEVTLEEFLNLPDVERFGDALKDSIQGFIGRVDRSWECISTVYLVLTGGGCDLPMVKRLAGMSLEIGGGRSVRLESTPRVPAFLEEYGEALSEEYPQLAVAMGGALPSVLDEGALMIEYPGESRPVGDLERYQSRGV